MTDKLIDGLVWTAFAVLVLCLTTLIIYVTLQAIGVIR